MFDDPAHSRPTHPANAPGAMMREAIRLMREQSEEIVVLMRHAAEAAASGQGDLAARALLDAEPLLFETSAILTATLILRRKRSSGPAPA